MALTPPLVDLEGANDADLDNPPIIMVEPHIFFTWKRLLLKTAVPQTAIFMIILLPASA
ncbi:MAG: hypothetical protein CM1200mP30_21870 [Pseudomonadota bacterium]|nr:MAG: hypothetical protein CM1200mP30_21870 [Pseudomonadota bacterium]